VELVISSFENYELCSGSSCTALINCWCLVLTIVSFCRRLGRVVEAARHMKVPLRLRHAGCFSTPPRPCRCVKPNGMCWLFLFHVLMRLMQRIAIPVEYPYRFTGAWNWFCFDLVRDVNQYLFTVTVYIQIVDAGKRTVFTKFVIPNSCSCRRVHWSYIYYALYFFCKYNEKWFKICTYVEFKIGTDTVNGVWTVAVLWCSVCPPRSLHVCGFQIISSFLYDTFYMTFTVHFNLTVY
jgi:hypothetical protein